MLKRPEDNELPEAQETTSLPARETTQTPDVKAICQGSLIVLPQGINVSEHADERCGDSSLIIAQEVAKDEVRHPLAISQLGGRLLPLLRQKIPQVPHLQDNAGGTFTSRRITKAQNH